MKRIKRIIYFFYYLKQTPALKFWSFLSYVTNSTGRSSILVLIDIVEAVFSHNVSFLDYFYFSFFTLNNKQRSFWAGTGFMYEYQLKMNPKNSRKVLEDKIEFLRNYTAFFNRKYCTLEELMKNPDKAKQILNHTSGYIVLKKSCGQAGGEVEILKSDNFSPSVLIDYMKSKGLNLAEEYVIQHPEMVRLSPSGLNTVRIITQITKDGNVDFLGARLRISVNSSVDNMAAGNLAAPVDMITGKVTGPGVYSDITKKDQFIHPVTGVNIVGFQIPFWTEICQMAKNAALFDTRNRSIGWDIAVTPYGPELIEGNHNWCKLLWQLPVKQGLKKELERYL